MAADGEELSRWIFGPDDARRYTQDSPVLPDVWLAYAEDPGERPHLLLTPQRQAGRKYGVNFRADDALSLRIDLLAPVTY